MYFENGKSNFRLKLTAFKTHFLVRSVLNAVDCTLKCKIVYALVRLNVCV